MRRILSTLMLVLALGGMLAVSSASNVYAASCGSSGNPLTCACGTAGASGSTACSATTNDPVTGPNGVIEKVTVLLALISGIVAVIIIVIAGLQFVVSGGDSQKIANARNAIIGAVVGLLIIAAAAGIITFVVGKI